MRKAWIIPALAAAAGLFCGVFRAFENHYVLDPATGLRAPGHPMTAVMLLVCAAIAAVLLIPAMRVRTEADARAVLSGSRGFRAGALVSAVALAALALGDLIRFSELGSFARLVLVGLSAFSAVSVVVVSAAGGKREAAGGSVFWVVPVFWACFWLILSYGEHAADPVIVDYLYTLVGEAMAVIALYLLAASAFDPRKLRWIAYFALLSVFFSVLSLTEPVACLLIFKNDALLEDLLTTRIYFVFPLALMSPVSAATLEKTPEKQA